MEIEAPRARVRVSLHTGELEVEGSESFIAKYAEALNALISRVQKDTPIARDATKGSDASRHQTGGPSQQSTAGDFPEALHHMSSTSGTDQILVAGSFARVAHADGTFATTEANALLLEQGIKLANPSQSMTNNLKAKRVFKSGKSWKISRTGEEYLRTLA